MLDSLARVSRRVDRGWGLCGTRESHTFQQLSLDKWQIDSRMRSTIDYKWNKYSIVLVSIVSITDTRTIVPIGQTFFCFRERVTGNLNRGCYGNNELVGTSTPIPSLLSFIPLRLSFPWESLSALEGTRKREHKGYCGELKMIETKSIESNQKQSPSIKERDVRQGQWDESHHPYPPPPPPFTTLFSFLFPPCN